MPTLAKKYLKAMLVILEGESAPMPREPYLIHAIQLALKPKRSLAPARKRRVVKAKANREEMASIHRTVIGRTGGKCEACFKPDERLEVDHFLGGNGRRRALQSMSSCWALCNSCHRAKTRNQPNPSVWLKAFVMHCCRMGFANCETSRLAQDRLESLEIRGRS